MCLWSWLSGVLKLWTKNLSSSRFWVSPGQKMSAAASKLTVRNKEGIVRMQLSCSLKIRFFFWWTVVSSMHMFTCSIQHLLHHWADPVHADPLCGLSANQDQWTHGSSRSVTTQTTRLCWIVLWGTNESHPLHLGVFVLLQVYAFLQYLKDRLTRQEFQTLFFLGVSLAAGVVFLSVIYLTYTGQCPIMWSKRT